MFQFPGSSRKRPILFGRPCPGARPGGFPHSEIRGSEAVCASPRLIAACHVLLRRPVPRHPPCALDIFSPPIGLDRGASKGPRLARGLAPVRCPGARSHRSIGFCHGSEIAFQFRLYSRRRSRLRCVGGPGAWMPRLLLAAARYALVKVPTGGRPGDRMPTRGGDLFARCLPGSPPGGPRRAFGDLPGGRSRCSLERR